MSRRDGRMGKDRGLGELPVAEDVRRELDYHLDRRVQELVAEGWTPEAARAEAERGLGDLKALSRECREVTESHRRARSRNHRLDALLQDLRYAARGLRRSPGFTLLAVATLSLGIGANTAIFSIVQDVLLAPPPYPDSDRIVTLWEMGESGNEIHVADANFLDWRSMSRSFEGMAAHPSFSFGGGTTILGGAEPVRVLTAEVSEDFFQVMGVAPELGRAFGELEIRSQATVAVVSHRFWRSQLGGRPLQGETLRIASFTLDVIGVMPPGFNYPVDSDVWVPLSGLAANPYRTAHNRAVTARLAAGVTLEQARDEMADIGARLKAKHGEEIDAVSVKVTLLQDELVGSLRRPLYMLFGAAVLVLLVACTNIASTLLARGSTRGQEMAVRASLGASRGRLVRQLLTESLLLAGLGAVAGLVLAAGVLHGFAGVAPATILDGSVLMFALAASFLTALLFGLLPAVRGAGGSVAATLRVGGLGSVGGRSSGVWSLLVGSEVALALVLLVGSGLLLKSFWTLLAVDPGFEPAGVITADFSAPVAEYPDDAALALFHEELLSEIRRIPGVRSAGLVNHLPMSGVRINGGFEIEGRGEGSGYGDYRVVSTGYFESMGISLLSGRAFDTRDGSGAPHAAIINQSLAERYFPEEDPVGKRIRRLANDDFVYGDHWITIIGVVGNVRHRGLEEGAPREVYVHDQQRPFRARSSNLTILTSSDAAGVVGAVRAAVRRVAPDVPTEFSTMEATVSSSMSDRRFVMLILGGFAGVALALSAVGIYGVVSYSVAQRTREIGIRIALGAAPAEVLGLVVRGTLKVVLAGMFVGLTGAVGLTRVMKTMLFEVEATDPATFLVMVLILGIAAVGATYIPARRSTTIDPMTTMRGP